MMLSAWQWTAAVLLFGCLISFAWAMKRFFVQPAGMTPGMRLIKVCGTLFALLHFAAIFMTPDIPAWRGAAGSALYLGAAALFWWAIRTNSRKPLSAAFSPDLPVHLMAQGPYRIIRHPLYCSYLLCWFAGWIVTGRLWLAPPILTMLVIYLCAAAQEEKKFLGSPLADNYRQYRASTGLIFPNFWKLLRANERLTDKRPMGNEISAVPRA